MTRCAAECDTPNSGPICRIVMFVRQYAATSSTRSARSSAHCRPGRPSAIVSPPRSATRRTSRLNWAGVRPVNGKIHSGRAAVITCPRSSLIIAISERSPGYETSLRTPAQEPWPT